MAKDLTVGNPTKLIISYSIPLLIGNIFQQLYSMVDTIIVGRYVSLDALAAVGSTGSINFLVLGFVWGLTGGFAVMIAQKFGSKDIPGLKKAVGSAAVLCILATILLTILSISTTNLLLRAMNTPDNIIQDAYIYIVTIYAGIGATMLYNITACILRAIGDSKTPLYFLILSSVLNIGLDLLFILVFGMEVFGAALATVIAQGFSGILCFIYMLRKYEILRLDKKDLKLDIKYTARHLYIGLPMAFQFSITAIGTIILQGALNLFGSTTIAAYSAACKIEQLVSQPAGTFGVAMANYSGQNLGANRIDRIKDGTTKCSIITVVCSILSALIIILFGHTLTGLFMPSDQAQPEVYYNAAQTYLNTIAIFFPFLNLLFVHRNVLQGIGKSLMPFLAGVFELIARTICAFTLPAILGYTGICLAGPIAWIAAAIPLAITYFYVMSKLMKSYKKKENVELAKN